MEECQIQTTFLAVVAVLVCGSVSVYLLYLFYTRVIDKINHDIDYEHVAVWIIWLFGALYIGAIIHEIMLPSDIAESNLQCLQYRETYKQAVDWANKQIAAERSKKLKKLVVEHLHNK